ncbi:hypothetical protein [Massilia horti]|uniref:Uncharacterized protein n=1 Tax=Massilia horti TaxID=2562153 RepID=A0A4Y9SKW5_9BURK|nr:hypothetical protein [Massilia horti]TFW27300.1 hypothetical protein E4O92_24240 [Massilia horti]
MDLLKHIEVALLLSFGLLCAAACLLQPPARIIRDNAAPAERDAVANGPPMPVVVITGKRLTAAEKRALAGERAG